jgi:hypothetical protein
VLRRGELTDVEAGRRKLIWALVLCLGLALLVWPGQLGGRDALTRFDTTRAMLEGTLAVDRSPDAQRLVGTVWYVRGPDGHVYSDYPLLHSVLMLPLAALYDSERTAALLFPLSFPLLLWLIHSLLVRSGVGYEAAIRTMLVIGLGTMVFPYAVDAHNNFLQALLVLLMVHGLFGRTASPAEAGAAEPARARWSGVFVTPVFVAGLALGGLLNVRLWALAAVPLALFLLVDPGGAHAPHPVALVRAWLRAAWSRATLWRVVSFSLGVAPLAALWLWYEWVRFGHPLGGLWHHTGTLSESQPLWAALGLLVSPSKSLLLFSPPLLLGLALLPRFFRRSPRLATAIVVGSLSMFVMNASYFAWHGDVCWGPRYLLPAVALLGLPISEVFAPGFTALSRTAVRSVVAFGLVTQLVAVSVHPFRFFIEHQRRDADHNGPRAVEYLFSLEGSAFFSAFFALPEVASQSWDGWAREFRETDHEAHRLDALRRDPEVPADVRRAANTRYLLLVNKRYNTLPYWWVSDAILAPSHRWPPAVGATLPLALLGLVLLGCHQVARRPRRAVG